MKLLVSKIILIFVAFLSFSCVQTNNSVSGDNKIYSTKKIDSSTPEGMRLSNFMNVINNHCISCHSATMALYSNDEWKDSGYLTPGSPTSSIIYCRIKGSGCGAEDMPESGAISVEELNSIRTFIENIQ